LTFDFYNDRADSDPNSVRFPLGEADIRRNDDAHRTNIPHGSLDQFKTNASTDLSAASFPKKRNNSRDSIKRLRRVLRRR